MVRQKLTSRVSKRRPVVKSPVDDRDFVDDDAVFTSDSCDSSSRESSPEAEAAEAAEAADVMIEGCESPVFNPVGVSPPPPPSSTAVAVAVVPPPPSPAAAVAVVPPPSPSPVATAAVPPVLPLTRSALKCAAKDMSLSSFCAWWPYPDISCAAAESVYLILQKELEADVAKSALDSLKMSLKDSLLPSEEVQKVQELHVALKKAEECLSDESKEAYLDTIRLSFTFEYNADKTDDEKRFILEKAKETYTSKALASYQKAKDALSSLDEQSALRTLLTTLGCPGMKKITGVKRSR